MWARYMRLLVERPYLTKSITAGTLMFAGDQIQQGIERRGAIQDWEEAQKAKKGGVTGLEPPSKPIDWVRSARMGGFGTVVIGPLFHNWFKVLERLVPNSGLGGTVAKTAIDQAVMAPFFTVFFFGSMALLEGKSVDEAKQRIKTLTLPTLEMNYKIWPAAQMINFYVIPVHLRVLWLNMVGLGFNTFLSKMNNAHHKPHNQSESVPPS